MIAMSNSGIPVPLIPPASLEHGAAYALPSRAAAHPASRDRDSKKGTNRPENRHSFSGLMHTIRLRRAISEFLIGAGTLRSPLMKGRTSRNLVSCAGFG
jgi:hypothetical protein